MGFLLPRRRSRVRLRRRRRIPSSALDEKNQPRNGWFLHFLTRMYMRRPCETDSGNLFLWENATSSSLTE